MVNLDNPKKYSPPIVKLDEVSISRIAAGEVIERPAAAVKELIENALDALASEIKISFSHGGKSLIKVVDNGWGIRKEELKLALASHATSKMHLNDLSNVKTLGFRGEALSSIAAVSKLTLKSRIQTETEATEINVNSGHVMFVKPAALSFGTTIEIQDLFYSTPARLKFLKTDRSETQAIFECVKRLALSKPSVRFLLQDIGREPKKIFLDLPKEQLDNKYFDRIKKVFGDSFTQNCVELDYENGDYSIRGYSSLPTNSYGTSGFQYFFVNGRSVKDKIVLSALRSAYFDFIPKDRFPGAVIYLTCDPSLVDINVHPMKSEVRFKFPKEVRGILINLVKKSLSKNGLRSNTILEAKVVRSFLTQNPLLDANSYTNESVNHNSTGKTRKEDNQPKFEQGWEWFSGKVEPDLEVELDDLNELPLGVAKAQLHKNFIVSQTRKGFILVDQHAAHERITYERLKAQLQNKRLQSQDLLIPEIIELFGNERDIVLEFRKTLLKIGFAIESFGENAVCLRSVPALLGLADLKNLMTDLIEELLTLQRFESLEQRVDAIISRISCHGSIRSGRKMNALEMNELLRQMESTPFAAQCNHGRPTFVELKLSDIEKLFGRS